MSALAILNLSLMVFAMFLIVAMGAQKIFAIIVANAKSRASDEAGEEDQGAVPRGPVKLSARDFVPVDFIHRRLRRRPTDTPPPR